MQVTLVLYHVSQHKLAQVCCRDGRRWGRFAAPIPAEELSNCVHMPSGLGDGQLRNSTACVAFHPRLGVIHIIDLPELC